MEKTKLEWDLERHKKDWERYQKEVLRSNRAILRVLLISGVLTIASGALAISCSPSKAGSARGELIPSHPGYTCFIVRDENGTAVGGNCLKE